MNIAQEVGTVIKSHRKKKKLSQKQLSVLVFGDETHQATISRLESGKHEKVQFDTVYNALKVLGVDIFKTINAKALTS